MSLIFQSAVVATKREIMYNRPLEYAQLVLSDKMEHYLSLGCEHGRLED